MRGDNMGFCSENGGGLLDPKGYEIRFLKTRRVLIVAALLFGAWWLCGCSWCVSDEANSGRVLKGSLFKAPPCDKAAP